MEKSKAKDTVCSACGGSGQVSFFKGESRFLLSTEECPLCFGFGYPLDSQESRQGEAERRPSQDFGSTASDQEDR